MTTHFTLVSDDRDDGDYYTRLEVAGDGDLEHYIDAFKAFLLAVGHHRDTVEALLPDSDDIDQYRRDAWDGLNGQMDASQDPGVGNEDADEQTRESRL